MKDVSLATPPVLPFESWPLDKLCSYIVKKHHTYVYENIPKIQFLREQLSIQDGSPNGSLGKISEVFKRMARDMNLHMMKEETILFPFIEQMVEASRIDITVARPFFGTVHNPTQIMQIEHEHSWEDMTLIRSLANDYKTGESDHQSVGLLYKKLEEFEADLIIHLDLENRILFPKAIEIEKKIGIS